MNELLMVSIPRVNVFTELLFLCAQSMPHNKSPTHNLSLLMSVQMLSITLVYFTCSKRVDDIVVDIIFDSKRIKCLFKLSSHFVHVNK